MLAKLKTLLLTLMLLAGVLAGAGIAHAEGYALTVNVKDTNYGVVDASGLTVKIYTFGTTTLVKQLSNYNPANFALEKGIYTVEASKEGYKTNSWNVNMNDGAQAVNILLEKLPTQPSQPSGSTGSTSSGTTQTTNTLIISDVDYKDEVKPGEEVTFDVDVKNDVSYDAENVQITVTIKDIDDGDDVDVSDEFSTLDKGDKDTYSLTLNIPKKVDAEKYSMETKVEWEDKDGKEYSNTRTTDKIEVVKETHDVQITEALFLASSTDAGKQNQVSVSLWNAGKNDETARIKVEIPDLKVSAMSAQFKLNENDETTQYVQFAVPADAKAGKYFAYVTVYFNAGTMSNVEMATLEIKAPATAQAEQKVSVAPVVVTTQTQPEETGGFGTIGLVIGVIIALLVLGMLVKEYSGHFLPKPTVIKATRSGR